MTLPEILQLIRGNIRDMPARNITAAILRNTLENCVTYISDKANQVLQANSFKPIHQWNGTKLKLQNPDGTYTDEVDLKATITAGSVTPEQTNFALTYGQDGSFNVSDGAGNIGMSLTPSGTLRIYKLELLQTILRNGIEYDLVSFVKNNNADFVFLKSMFQAFTNNEVVITDAEGAIGWKLAQDGTMHVSKASLKKLLIGGTTTTENPDFLFAIADPNTAFAFAINRLGVVLAKAIQAQAITTKTLTITESISLPASFSLADKLAFVYGKPSDWLHVISYGQSNSAGGGNLVAVSTVQKYDALMPSGGRAVATGGDVTNVLPFVESVSESPLAGLMEKFTEQLADQNLLPSPAKGFQLVGTTPGQGATNIANLSKGTEPYNRLLDNCIQLKALALSKGKSYSVGFIAFTQGEQDVSEGLSYADYKAALNLLVANMNADVVAITGQKNSIPVISYQIAWGGDLDRIAKAQLDLSVSNPMFILACPSYPFDYEPPGLIHFTPAFRRIYGAYLAVAAKKMLVDGVKFRPLMPIQLAVSGTTLLITYYVPKGPLVLDTVAMPDPGNYGFKVLAAGGAVLALSNIKIINSNTVSIDCSASPAGGSFYYAKGLTAANVINAQNTAGKLGNRGCLRDSQGDTLVFDNYPLHNWAVASTLPI